MKNESWFNQSEGMVTSSGSGIHGQDDTALVDEAERGGTVQEVDLQIIAVLILEVVAQFVGSL